MKDVKDMLEMSANVLVPLKKGKSSSECCKEAQEILRETGIDVTLNIPIPDEDKVKLVTSDISKPT